MNFELLAEQYINHKENETVVIQEWGGLLKLLPLVLGPSVAYYAAKNDLIPEWAENMSNEWWWAGLSLFDPTGMMTMPYVKKAMDRIAAGDDSQWASILLILSIMGTIPGFGIGARFIVRIFTLPIRTGKYLSKLFTWSGRNVISKSSRIMDDIFPNMIAKSTGRKYKGVDEGVLIRKSIERSFGIRVSDDAIQAALKKQGKVGLMGRVGSGVGKIGSTTGKIVGGTARGVAAIGRPAGRAAKTVTGLAALGGAFGGGGGNNNGSSGSRRTPQTMGGGAKFGYIGGVVK